MQNIQNTIKDEDGVTLCIDLEGKGYAVNGHEVTSVTMYADSDCCGDLAVNWKFDEKDNEGYVEGAMLLMRNTNSEDKVTETMGEFYWQDGFADELTEILIDNGFSKEAAEDVTTSEWGMQDEGRASYDAWMIADEMLKQHGMEMVE
mgnify:FL=1